MRNVSIDELEHHIPDLEAGHRLTLVHGGKLLAEVVPLAGETSSVSGYPVKWQSEEERRAAIDDLMKVLREGYDMGDFKVTDRDALYDRG